MIKKLRSKYEKGFEVFGHFFSWPFIYRAALVVLNLFLLSVIRYQSIRIEQHAIKAIENEAKVNALVMSNSYYQAERNNSAKLINELPNPFWKQEYFPATNQILMMDYNEAMWVEFLKPMNHPRWYYTLKQDNEVFPPEQAKIFRSEKMELIRKWMAQKPDSLGRRPAVFQPYSKTWVGLNGDNKSEGYWRSVDGQDGHIFVYGGTNSPKERQDIKIMKVIFNNQ